MRRREPADASADHHQIKALAGFNWLSSGLPKVVVAEAVRNFKRAHVASPQAVQRRWIVARSFLGIELVIEVAHSLRDRKSTRLNSSHQIISYAVFCLKKKNTTKHI